MAFPKQVLKAKQELESSNPNRWSTLILLTEPKDTNDDEEGYSAYLQDFEKMWQIIYDTEKQYYKMDGCQWISDFLDIVKEASNLPPHAYVSKQDRKDIIKRIFAHTKGLEKIYSSYGLDKKLISNDGQFFHGFSAYEGGFIAPHKPSNANDKKKDTSKVSVIETLQFFADHAEEEISSFSEKGKAGETIKATRFIRMLGARNLERYGEILPQVIKTAAFAVYNLEYKDADILNLIRGRKKKNTPKE